MVKNDLLEAPCDMRSWQYLTASIPGVSFNFKTYLQDFEVEEIPAYEPCGEGEHTYIFIEKEGIPTFQAIRDIASKLDISVHDMSSAGLKDARGVTRQWLSLRGVSPEEVKQVEIPKIKFLKAARHKNKLRIGHLRGNRFILRLRNHGVEAKETIETALRVLEKRGVPNYFGPQRFGMRGDNPWVGKALIQGDHEAALRWIAGNPLSSDHGMVQKARILFNEGRYEESASMWPREFKGPLKIARTMARTGKAKNALYGLGKDMQWFYITAFQSFLFNEVLSDRVLEMDKLFKGDLAFKHDNGAVFLVDDPAQEQSRVDRFEISPSGPLLGSKLTEPDRKPFRLEDKVFRKHGVNKETFQKHPKFKCAGARRSFRFKLEELDLSESKDEFGEFIRLSFRLDRGCYATSLLRELGKDQMRESV